MAGGHQSAYLRQGFLLGHHIALGDRQARLRAAILEVVVDRIQSDHVEGPLAQDVGLFEPNPRQVLHPLQPAGKVQLPTDVCPDRKGAVVAVDQVERLTGPGQSQVRHGGRQGAPGQGVELAQPEVLVTRADGHGGDPGGGDRAAVGARALNPQLSDLQRDVLTLDVAHQGVELGVLVAVPPL